MLTKKPVSPNILKTCFRLISSNAFKIALSIDFASFFTIHDIYVSSKYIFERMSYEYFDSFN